MALSLAEELVGCSAAAQWSNFNELSWTDDSFSQLGINWSARQL